MRAERKREEEAERLRLYYVAMTRAIDRLIVSGAIDPGRDERARRRRSAGCSSASRRAASSPTRRAPVELERGDARFLLRVDRGGDGPARATEPEPEAAVEEGQLALFGELPGRPGARRADAARARAGARLRRCTAARRLSFTALSLFERCSYRYYAERVAGMRERDASSGVPGAEGLAATELGDAVHGLLEELDLGAPRVPDDLEEQVRAAWPAATDENVERIRELVAAYCDSDLAARLAGLEGAAPERHFTFSTTACCCTASSTSSTPTARARSSSTTRRTCSTSSSPRP